MSAPEPVTMPGGAAPARRGGRGWLIAAAVVNGLVLMSLLAMAANGQVDFDNADATSLWWVSLIASVLAPFYAWNLWRRGRSGIFVQVIAWSPVATWVLAAFIG